MSNYCFRAGHHEHLPCLSYEILSCNGDGEHAHGHKLEAFATIASITWSEEHKYVGGVDITYMAPAQEL